MVKMDEDDYCCLLKILARINKLKQEELCVQMGKGSSIAKKRSVV